MMDCFDRVSGEILLFKEEVIDVDADSDTIDTPDDVIVWRVVP